MDARKITTFTDLKAWRESHKLALAVYDITDSFPRNEQFGLSSQLRRAAVSVGSNIAEGFGRSTRKDKEHFFIMASGSVYEIKSQLILARDLKFMQDHEFQNLASQANLTHKLLHGLLRVHRALNV